MLNRTKTFFILALVLATLMPVSAALAEGAPANKSLVKKLVGSWQGSNDVGVEFLLSFNRGNTMTVTFVVPGVGSAHGHGEWRRTGLDTFESTDVAFILNPNDGSISLLQKTNASFTVGAGNDTVDIDLSIELSLPDGTPVDAFTSFSTAERIAVVPFP